MGEALRFFLVLVDLMEDAGGCFPRRPTRERWISKSCGTSAMMTPCYPSHHRRGSVCEKVTFLHKKCIIYGTMTRMKQMPRRPSELKLARSCVVALSSCCLSSPAPEARLQQPTIFLTDPSSSSFPSP